MRKILQSIKRIFKKEEEKEIILKYELLLKENGDVLLETECHNFEEDSITIIATLLFLLNTGKLAELHIQSIQMWAEDHPEQEEFIEKVLSVWNTLLSSVMQEVPPEFDQPVVNPLTALESDTK